MDNQCGEGGKKRTYSEAFFHPTNLDRNELAFIEEHTPDNIETEHTTVIVHHNGTFSKLKMDWDYEGHSLRATRQQTAVKNETLLKSIFPKLIAYHVTVHDSIQSIGRNAFYDCSALKSITLPNSIQSIGNCAFFECSALKSITLPDSIQSIGKNAFYDCSALESITLPNSIQSIGEGAFEWCKALESITLPNSIHSIGERAFDGCSALESITLPDSIQSIGYYAFDGCRSLQKITLSKSCLQKHSTYINTLIQNNRNVVLDITDETTQICVICYKNMDVNVIFTKCTHVSICITCSIKGKYLHNGNEEVRCPVCNTVQKSTDVKLVTHTT